jgi:hypothetical protein
MSTIIKDIEYITREPKYRVKTLVELVTEYGDEVSAYIDYNGNHKLAVGDEGPTIDYDDLGVEAIYTRPYGNEWKRVFLKEI